jgi:hypothetical protein
MKRTLCSAATAVALLAFPHGLSAQQQSPDVAALASWLRQVQPDLEKALGYPLPKLPRLQFGTLREAADPDTAAHLRWRFPHLKDAALARALEDARTVNNSATLARLLDGTNVIFVRPDNQRQIAGWDKDLSGAFEPDFLKLALVHETVRYALDVRHDLPRRRQACRDAEEWFALQALVEGRTQQVTRQLASKLGMEKSFPLLAERFLHAPDASPDPGLRTTSQSAMRQLHWACTSGRLFYSYLQEHGVADIERQVFSQPPRVVQWIENPDLYLRTVQSRGRDLATIMRKLEGMLPGAEWRPAQQAWTPAMVIQAAQVFVAKGLAEKRVEAWQEGRTILWTHRTNPVRLVSLSVTRLQTTNAARSFFNFTLDLDRKADEMVKAADSRSRSIRITGADEAVLSERTIGGQASWALRVRRGEQFIELDWYGGPADLTWAQDLVQALH